MYHVKVQGMQTFDEEIRTLIAIGRFTPPRDMWVDRRTLRSSDPMDYWKKVVAASIVVERHGLFPLNIRVSCLQRAYSLLPEPELTHRLV